MFGKKLKVVRLNNNHSNSVIIPKFLNVGNVISFATDNRFALMDLSGETDPNELLLALSSIGVNK